MYTCTYIYTYAYTYIYIYIYAVLYAYVSLLTDGDMNHSLLDPGETNRPW